MQIFFENRREKTIDSNVLVQVKYANVKRKKEREKESVFKGEKKTNAYINNRYREGQEEEEEEDYHEV